MYIMTGTRGCVRCFEVAGGERGIWYEARGVWRLDDCSKSCARLNCERENGFGSYRFFSLFFGAEIKHRSFMCSRIPVVASTRRC